MAIIARLGFLGLLLRLLSAFHAVSGEPDLWPLPSFVRQGTGKLLLSKNLELRSNGSRYLDTEGILKGGFERMVALLAQGHEVDGEVSLSSRGVLAGLHVVVHSPDGELNFGINESYNLTVPVNADTVYAYVEAATVYGALHAFQTFSQLCWFNFDSRIVELHGSPLYIADQPRFPYRGILIDTSRHYEPLLTIKKVIDGMTYTKLNVLHWHIVDRESFPIQTPSYPRLWEGAYSYMERYTTDDALEIVEYAKRRGINVMAEIDVPGHAKSWGIGYPSLLPSTDCKEPLDVSNNFTFEVIDGILSDFSKIFKFKFVHLGGDEVDLSCWLNTPRIKKWMDVKGMTELDAYAYFVLRAQKIASSHGYEFINWEETFNNFASKLNPKTVVHNWIGPDVAPKVVAAGLRCIVSNQDVWYLDHLDTTWQQFYKNEPLTNITKPAQQKLVIGGEVCMWGETVDTSDIEQTIWPRAAAAAERLWTPIEKLAKDPEQVAGRLARFRCLLNQRGVAAAPLYEPGRGSPPEYGSCYLQ